MSNDTRAQQAFSPQYWPIVLEEYAHNGGSFGATLVNTVGFKEETRIEAAAIALYGQPFGFTHADVKLLHEAADFADDSWVAESGEAKNLRALAARIAALLPPHSGPSPTASAGGGNGGSV